jgi:hypothetical protein
MPRVELDATTLDAVGHGRPVRAEGNAAGEAALVRDGRLVAIAEGADGWWHPRVVMVAA